MHRLKVPYGDTVVPKMRHDFIRDSREAFGVRLQFEPEVKPFPKWAWVAMLFALFFSAFLFKNILFHV